MYEQLTKAIMADRLREAEAFRLARQARAARAPLRCRIDLALTRLGHALASLCQTRQQTSASR